MVMATVYMFAGEYDNAMDELEYLLSIPSWCTIKYIKADPIFDPLENMPRFKSLAVKYARSN